MDEETRSLRSRPFTVLSTVVEFTTNTPNLRNGKCEGLGLVSVKTKGSSVSTVLTTDPLLCRNVTPEVDVSGVYPVLGSGP